ncbi:hypothetical protein ABZ366_06340, partial [Streptomyces sp. NPDC005904]|uniref:hypothetical protein n=1 Tax=Streptomyces sp. NPDC005904 TaxID=3154570 RepID=UPI003410881D
GDVEQPREGGARPDDPVHHSGPHGPLPTPGGPDTGVPTYIHVQNPGRLLIFPTGRGLLLARREGLGLLLVRPERPALPLVRPKGLALVVRVVGHAIQPTTQAAPPGRVLAHSFAID